MSIASISSPGPNLWANLACGSLTCANLYGVSPLPANAITVAPNAAALGVGSTVTLSATSGPMAGTFIVSIDAKAVPAGGQVGVVFTLSAVAPRALVMMITPANAVAFVTPVLFVSASTASVVTLSTGTAVPVAGATYAYNYVIMA